VVNRLWQTYFGIGIVTTPEDFGMQSEPPSHPELLDWLASELMQPTIKGGGPLSKSEENPWSLKHIHRLIVTSAAYRQSSKTRLNFTRAILTTAWSHADRDCVSKARLSAILRFLPAACLIQKLVDRPFFSRTGFPFPTPGQLRAFPVEEETGADRYRRAVYTFRRRSPPTLSCKSSTRQTAISHASAHAFHTPLQALASLNETVFVECAQALAKKTLESGGRTDDERVTYAFRRALSRLPDADEKKELLSLLEKQMHRIPKWVGKPQ